jgi:hypothetical protein
MHPDLTKAIADQLIAERLRDAERVRLARTKPRCAAQTMIPADRCAEPPVTRYPECQGATPTISRPAARSGQHASEWVSETV